MTGLVSEEENGLRLLCLYKMIWPCVPTPLYLYQCAAIVESGQGWAGPELHLAVTLAPPPPPVPPFHQHVNTNITATFLRDLSSNKNVKKII